MGFLSKRRQSVLRKKKIGNYFSNSAPLFGAHTQTIESMWQKLKFQAKERYGIINLRYSDYLTEFILRKEFGKSDEVLLQSV